MRFGVGFFATDQTVPPGELGRMVEQRGFRSIFLTEPRGLRPLSWRRARQLDPRPIVQAKAVGTPDRISGGRVDFGIGAGWNEPEV